MTDGIADVVRAEIARDGITTVEELIFGTPEPTAIARIVEGFCQSHLSSTVARALFFRVTVGCTFGVELAGGNQIVIKVFQPRWSEVFLNATRRVQDHIARSGFPAPRPLGPLARLGPEGCLAAIDTYLPDPGMRPFTEPSELQESARTLARLMTLAQGMDPTGLGQSPMRHDGALYPTPHSPVFDFESTAEGAAWIDRFAAEAKRAMAKENGELVITHADWSARNIRIVESQLVASYDWDSAAATTEATAVGQAALTWRSTSEPGDGPFPALGELDAYYKAYEQARGHAIDRRGARAASLYLLSYIARCEHSLAGKGLANNEPVSARRRLSEDGRQFL